MTATSYSSSEKCRFLGFGNSWSTNFGREALMMSRCRSLLHREYMYRVRLSFEFVEDQVGTTDCRTYYFNRANLMKRLKLIPFGRVMQIVEFKLNWKKKLNWSNRANLTSLLCWLDFEMLNQNLLEPIIRTLTLIPKLTSDHTSIHLSSPYLDSPPAPES